jgi:hypothetical protein
MVPNTTNTWSIGSSSKTLESIYTGGISIGGNVFNGGFPNLYTNNFNLLCYPDDSGTLGGPSNRWSNIYGEGLTISGTAEFNPPGVQYPMYITTASTNSITATAITVNGFIFAFVNGIGWVSTASIVPSVDNVGTIGSAANRWTTIYATNGTIQTSDGTLKSNVSPLDSSMGLSFINALQPKTWNWCTGDTERTHYGFVYQDVVPLLNGTTNGIVYDPVTTTNADGTTSTSHASMSYSELISPLILAVQQLSAQVTSLQSQVTTLNNDMLAIKAGNPIP